MTTHWIAAKMAEPTCTWPNYGGSVPVKMAELTEDTARMTFSEFSIEWRAAENPHAPFMAMPPHTHVWSPWFANVEKCWGCGISRSIGNSYSQIGPAIPEPVQLTRREQQGRDVARAIGRMWG